MEEDLVPDEQFFQLDNSLESKDLFKMTREIPVIVGSKNSKT